MLKKILLTGIALVWLINGLFFKFLNFVPRHRLIVARILGEEHSSMLTKLIGSGEVLVCIWIISRIKSRICALVQIITIAAMNIIEFIVAPDLLMFGRMNIVVAICFIFIIIFAEFIIDHPGQKAPRKINH